MARSEKFDKSPDKRDAARKTNARQASRLTPQQKGRPSDGKGKQGEDKGGGKG